MSPCTVSSLSSMLVLSRPPEERTIVRIRHRLGEHDPSIQLLVPINATLANRGLVLKTGAGERDPEMYPTKKGNQWHVGMKAHRGVIADSGWVHAVIGTVINLHDAILDTVLLQSQEETVFTATDYQRADKREGATGVDWHVAIRLG